MQKHDVVIRKIVQHSHDIVTLFFTLPSGDNLPYTAGQYVSVYAPGGSVPEGKAYSLSSAPHEHMMSITVKKIGEYSGYLHSLKPGDTLQVSSPYGHFNPRTDKPLICIGAGVGLCPAWSVLKDEYHKDVSRVAHLFCSNKTTADIPHKDEVDALAATSNLKVKHHVTRQKTVPKTVHNGRIELDNIVNLLEEEAMYLVCGSVEFVRSMYAGLTERGILPRQISTETFFEQ